MAWTQAEADRFQEIGRLLQGAPLAMHLVADAFKWEPLNGSELDLEYKNTEVGPGGDAWGPEPVEIVATHCKFWMILAGHALDGLGTLYLADKLIESPWPLWRSVIEKCAATAWLLEVDEVRKRVARGLLFELEDRRQAKNRAAYAIGQDPGVAVTPEATAFQTFQDSYIPRLFDPTTLTSGEIGGQKMLGYTGLVKNFIDKYVHGGSGQEAYSILSSHTHPSTTGYISLFRAVPGGSGVQLQESFDNLVNGAQLAVIIHYKTAATLAQCYGWQAAGDPFEFWADKITAVFPNALR